MAKKISTGGQRKNKFQDIPKGGLNAQQMSGHHATTSSKKQYSHSAQRIFSPKSQNQLFKGTNMSKSKQSDDAQPVKHISAQHLKRKAAESQEFRSQSQAEDQELPKARQ